MELQMKYQYTYFIYPYVIEKKRLNSYILKLLNNKKCEINNWNKEKDLDIYNFFLPTVRKYMFNNFKQTKNSTHVLQKENNIMFNYKLQQDIQGKVEKNSGIFFSIQKINILCFKCGLCFLIFKTNVENSKNFSDILDFNYKFRDINSDFGILKEYENIKIQTDAFENMKKITEFIDEITDNAKSCNEIDTNRFYTYSYVCIEQENWNNQNKSENLEREFIKFSNILPSNYNVNINVEEKDIDKWKYTKLGITDYGVTLLCSSIDNKNYTILPEKYQNEYLYLYIVALYEKLYMKRLILDMKSNNKTSKTDYLNLKTELLSSNITNDDYGNNLYNGFIQSLRVEETSNEINELLNIEHKKLDIERTKKENKILFLILSISLIVNIINFILLFYK